MASRGARRVLQPILYIGLAALAHVLLFLIPGVGGGKSGTGTLRGVRIKAIAGGGTGERAGTGGRAVGVRDPREKASTAEPAPPVVAENSHSSVGGGAAGQAVETAGTILGTGSRIGTGGSPGHGGPGGMDGSTKKSEIDSYLDRLKSKSVQGWARETANQNRQDWKSAVKAEDRPAVVKDRGSDGGSRPGPGPGYLDPRVKVVVTSYPSTGIERRHTQIPYPDRKVQKNRFTAGWWNVYVQIRTDATGKIARRDVLRPETNGPLERIFVEQVNREIDKWSFDPKEAEINVDVRFYVE